MTEDQFWSLIEQSRAISTECEDQAEALTGLLVKLEPEQIVEFSKLWDERRRESYRWDLWAVAYIVNGGASDDGFEYFRSWLIGQGREFYEAMLISPNHIMTRVPADRDYIECETLWYAANRAYENRTGQEMPNYGIVRDPAEPVGEHWEEEDLPRLYSELCAFYDGEQA